MTDDRVQKLRERLLARYERLGSWPQVADGADVTPEYIRQIAKGEKEPSDQTLRSLENWISAPTGPNELPKELIRTAPGEREKLIQWLEWLTEILRHDLLPGLVWEGGGEGGGPGGAGEPSRGGPPVGGGAERLSPDREDQADEGA